LLFDASKDVRVMALADAIAGRNSESLTSEDVQSLVQGFEEAAAEASRKLWHVLNLEKARQIGLGRIPESPYVPYPETRFSKRIFGGRAKDVCKRKASSQPAQGSR
jgi:hypothetical protein